MLGRRKSDYQPNLKNARSKGKQNRTFDTNRFSVLAKLQDDNQSSSSIQLAPLALHESFSEPDVGLTSSGNLIFKEDPSPV